MPLVNPTISRSFVRSFVLDVAMQSNAMQCQRDEKERAVAKQRNKVKVKENAAADTCLVIVSQFNITPARAQQNTLF